MPPSLPVAFFMAHLPRKLDFEGAHNFRDMGGYPLEGGRQVRAGRLFRSDHLGRLTDTDQQLLEEQSLLRSGDQPLPVSLEIPDAVLTGSRYDVDVIFEQPLGQAIVAGGLIPLTPQEVAEQARPNLRLEPMGGGGLFKTVQAPQTPGSQFWAAMLVHPDGVVTMTKRVRVVSSKQELDQ